MTRGGFLLLDRVPPLRGRAFVAAEITAWCRSLGYSLEVCAEPHKRPDVVGLRGASPHAQLCADKVIAVAGLPCGDQLCSIAHEMAHGEEPGRPEEIVHSTAAAMLATLAAAALERASR